MEAILAFDIKKCISSNGVLPWNIKEDLQFFYNKTKCNIVIMGRNKYFSIPHDKREFKNRLNIILTKEPHKYKEITETYKNVFFTDNEKYMKLYYYFLIIIMMYILFWKSFLKYLLSVEMKYIKKTFQYVKYYG